MAMMSHMKRACSRRSSGKPFAGRSIVKTGRFFCFARSSALSLLFRMPSTRFSTSRTLVRYSSSLALSLELIARLRVSASPLTRSRMLMLRRLPRFSKRLSQAKEG